METGLLFCRCFALLFFFCCSLETGLLFCSCFELLVFFCCSFETGLLFCRCFALLFFFCGSFETGLLFCRCFALLFFFCYSVETGLLFCCCFALLFFFCCCCSSQTSFFFFCRFFALPFFFCCSSDTSFFFSLFSLPLCSSKSLLFQIFFSLLLLFFLLNGSSALSQNLASFDLFWRVLIKVGIDYNSWIWSSSCILLFNYLLAYIHSFFRGIIYFTASSGYFFEDFFSSSSFVEGDRVWIGNFRGFPCCYCNLFLQRPVGQSKGSCVSDLSLEIVELSIDVALLVFSIQHDDVKQVSEVVVIGETSSVLSIYVACIHIEKCIWNGCKGCPS